MTEIQLNILAEDLKQYEILLAHYYGNNYDLDCAQTEKEAKETERMKLKLKIIKVVLAEVTKNDFGSMQKVTQIILDERTKLSTEAFLKILKQYNLPGSKAYYLRDILNHDNLRDICYKLLNS